VAKRTYVEPLWHVQLTVLLALALQIGLPARLVIGPRFVVPSLEAILLIGLTLTTPKRYEQQSRTRQMAAVAMIMVTSIANAGSLFLLVRYLANGGKTGGEELILSALNLFATNIIVFALWYWEIDAGGPGARHNDGTRLPDFMFPQLNSKELAPEGWIPTFVDYLYVSATNATAFSPTDTLPLTHRAKLLMLAQSLVSLLTVALVAARAVNILS
jgi:uncharacterized membrane protein